MIPSKPITKLSPGDTFKFKPYSEIIYRLVFLNEHTFTYSIASTPMEGYKGLVGMGFIEPDGLGPTEVWPWISVSVEF